MDGPDDPLDDLFNQIAPLTDAEKIEYVLTCFAAVIEGMDRDTLLKFRAHVVTMHPGTKEEATILEVIDGQLALRELK